MHYVTRLLQPGGLFIAPGEMSSLCVGRGRRRPQPPADPPADGARRVVERPQRHEAQPPVIATALSPAEAMQPHCEQSGVPPNWQGVIRVFKSAVSESVVRAKMHSAGERGGWR